MTADVRLLDRWLRWAAERRHSPGPLRVRDLKDAERRSYGAVTVGELRARCVEKGYKVVGDDV